MRPHISLNVRDVQSSAEFYRKVFGVTPQKQTVDYAKFDLTTPPLNFSLVSSTDCTRPPTASLSPDVSPSQSPAAPRRGFFPWPKPAKTGSFPTDAALPSAISAVNHLGIEVDDPGEVAEWERRLREQGILEKVQNNVSCCYARQNKVWFTDPDGNELGSLHGARTTTRNDAAEGHRLLCPGVRSREETGRLRLLVRGSTLWTPSTESQA